MIDILSVASATPAEATSFVDRILDWANVESTAGLLLVGFGLIAQALFFLRWIVQWAASERQKVSHVPIAFWWISLAGATLLFIYYVLRGEPVGVIGQSVGWIVYLRNLMLISKQARSQTLTSGDAT